jgi:addiction module RelB/DinJ family antitoxin
MEKTATLNLRVNPSLKSEAETILSRLGIPMSTAVDMFLNQVVMVGGIPFSVKIPKQSADIDLSQMTDEQIHAKLQRGYDDYKAGLTMDAATAFSKFRESHS